MWVVLPRTEVAHSECGGYKEVAKINGWRVLILVTHTKESKEVIRKCTNIGEHFTQEISLEYCIYFFYH